MPARADAELVQTFVPFPDFERSARVLDSKRLGKQRVEALQIVRALTWPTYAWKSHPAVLMWKGHEPALGAYSHAICEEWTSRGFSDTCDLKIANDLADAGFTEIPAGQHEADLPSWWGDEAVHRSHRSSLLRKEPDHYRPLFEPDLPDDLDYVWPVQVEPTPTPKPKPKPTKARARPAPGPAASRGPAEPAKRAPRVSRPR